MNCFSCGEENPDDAKSCIHCGEWLAGDRPPPPKNSPLATMSLYIAAVGFVFLLLTPPFGAGGLAGILSFMLAAMAIVQIRLSRGMLKGLAYAVPALMLSCLLISFSVITLKHVPKARSLARRASCRSNLKRISLALEAYSNDHDNRFPPGNTAVEVFSALAAEVTDGPDRADPYIFLCPADKAGLEAWDRLEKLTEETVSYEWVPGLSPDADPDFILAYDKSPDHHDGGRNVLRVDGSVDFMPEAAFQPEMAHQRELMKHPE